MKIIMYFRDKNIIYLYIYIYIKSCHEHVFLHILRFKMLLDAIIGYARNQCIACIRLSQMDFIFCVAAPYIATVLLS